MIRSDCCQDIWTQIEYKIKRKYINQGYCHSTRWLSGLRMVRINKDRRAGIGLKHRKRGVVPGLGMAGDNIPTKIGKEAPLS